MKASLPKILLHAEGLAVFFVSCALYHRLGASWGLFALLFLAPDLFMLGYLGGPAIGARCYNAVHTYTVPMAIAAGAWLAGHTLVVSLCVIWIAHIGLDRLCGYGLKYPTAFKDTHLSRV
ncbi:MAG TPA: DUF4260 domain-containing protein [Opitutaceae bacterium]|nr:DUF4260 domain-containing protein [Opitutaceae bacterium]